MTAITPITPGAGADVTRFNALRHGVLSRYAVLPWEDAAEYQALLAALIAEHGPRGPTEEHLVEELAGIMWRKRRLRLAEAAAFRRGLSGTFSKSRDTANVAVAHLGAKLDDESLTDAVRASPVDTEGELAETRADEAMTRRALKRLAGGRDCCYEAALAEVREDTRAWWENMLARKADDLNEGERPYSADADGLRRFIETLVMPWFGNRRLGLTNREAVRDQAFGEALDPDKLEQLGRYEVRLDRKLERTLAMLVRLKDLRAGGVPA